ncbi:hypothetical protein G9A89_011408 [Geosiphon pyriformis]|nr:hypothetical protein G9A89_011408 [Geosiphon pyriformis]
MTTITDINSNRIDNNDNNLGNSISIIVITIKNWVMLCRTAKRKQLIRIKETSININHNISQPQDSHIMPLNIKINIHPNCFRDNTPLWPIPTGYPNQASYLNLTETQNFCNASFAKERNISKVPDLLSLNQLMMTSNIPPTTIMENMTLATIFLFNINSLKTTNLFSEAAINPDKPITAMYADARVGNLDIKLILNSKFTDSIITKQLMDQLGCQVDYAATVKIITANGNTKTPIGEIDNFPFEINGIQILTKKLQITFNEQHAQVPATCGHFKIQNFEQPLIEFKETNSLPTIETYQVSWTDNFQMELPLPPT